ncbi:MAG: hypothetical protein AAFY60_10685, partial [Myxococcota bacterium]
MRHTKARLLGAALLLTASAACGESIEVVSQETEGVVVPDQGSTGGEAQTAIEVFDGSVAQVLAAKCASCHGDASPANYTKFLPAETGDYHERLIADSTMVTDPPGNSKLIVFGGAAVTSAVHVGTQFSSEEEADVLGWLALEVGVEAPAPVESPVNEPTPGTDPEEGDPPPPAPVTPGTAPDAIFATNVQPIVRAMCAGCHEGAAPIGPVLTGSDSPDDDYQAMTSNTRLMGGFNAGTALLMIKGPHSGSLWWDTAQADAITAWLDAEFSERNNGEAPTPVAPSGDLMAEFVGCMNLDDWNLPLDIGGDEYTMHDWADRNAAGNTECQSCHSDGEFFFAVNNDNLKMFNQQRTSFFATSFFTLDVDPATGQPAVMVAREKIAAKCRGENLHPECQGNNANYLAVVEQFRELTMARMMVGDCGPAAYIDDTNVFEAEELILDEYYVVDQNNGNGDYVRLIDNGDLELTG